MTSPPPTLPTPLPWRWFEFRRPPAFLVAPPPPNFGHDPDAVHAISVDGHTIPFKFLRRPAVGGNPRPVLLMLHGMGLTIATYHDVAPFLLPTHDLLLPDYSGLSLTQSALPDHTNIKAMAASMWRLADTLGLERVSLAGNSLGGGMALLATLMQPQRVDRLLLSNPAVFPQVLPQMYRWARVPLWGELILTLAAPEKLIAGLEYIGYVDPARFHPVLRGIYMANLETPRNRLRLMQLIRQLPANDRDTAGAPHLRELSAIRHPTLITWGVQDRLLAPGAGDRLAAAMPAATYETYPELAHMPHEEAPENIGPRWAAFLTECRIQSA